MFKQFTRGGKIIYILGTFPRPRKFFSVGPRPSIDKYNEAISAAVKANDLDRALEHYRHLPTLGLAPNSQTYSLLINGYSSRAQPQDITQAVDLFSHMTATEQPDPQTFVGLIEAWSRSDKKSNMNLPRRIYDAMISTCSPQKVKVKDIAVFVRVMLEHRMYKDADYVYRSLLRQGKNFDFRGYRDLINAHLKSGRLLTATAYYYDMLHIGVRPTSGIVIHLIEAHAARGDLSGALQIYLDTRTKFLMPPAVATVLVRELAWKNKMRRAEDILSHAPTPGIYSILIRQYLRMKLLNNAWRLTRDLLTRYPDGVVVVAPLVRDGVKGFVSVTVENSHNKAERKRKNWATLGVHFTDDRIPEHTDGQLLLLLVSRTMLPRVADALTARGYPSNYPATWVQQVDGERRITSTSAGNLTHTYIDNGEEPAVLFIGNRFLSINDKDPPDR
ncbi:uncharacterized protein VTP21DRAFT_6461 [Calcarisporiella thermophila]|uniref:uncharacterized protein n=1 Tax=Calcarisporiella thermophila TaxID=911321 RepID=UPI003742562B